MLGRVESIWRYPVKSMRGEEVDEIFVAFTGLMSDRVYAIQSSAADPAFPWHTAREQEDLVLYQAGPLQAARRHAQARQHGRGDGPSRQHPRALPAS